MLVGYSIRVSDVEAFVGCVSHTVLYALLERILALNLPHVEALLARHLQAQADEDEVRAGPEETDDDDVFANAFL